MNIEIANRLVRLRKEKNLSQEALANELGISRQAVSKWERAEASPDTDNLILLAKLYGMSLDDLLKTDQKEFESGNNQQASKEKTEEDKKQKKKESVHISFHHRLFHIFDLCRIRHFGNGLLALRRREPAREYSACPFSRHADSRHG